jgi:hypothetical protein
MGVAMASVVALLLTHHRWQAGLLAVALVVLHIDFVRQAARAAQASQLQPAGIEAGESAGENQKVAA